MVVSSETPKTCEAKAKTTFVVINENILGCVDPRFPYQAQILSASVIRGADPYAHVQGTYPLSSTGVRPATVRDFDIFRVDLEGYQNDPLHYEAPTDTGERVSVGIRPPEVPLIQSLPSPDLSAGQASDARTQVKSQEI